MERIEGEVLGGHLTEAHGAIPKDLLCPFLELTLEGGRNLARGHSLLDHAVEGSASAKKGEAFRVFPQGAKKVLVVVSVEMTRGEGGRHDERLLDVQGI